MPQGRRKVAFSAKKKKDQLLQKRQLKASQKYLRNHDDSDEEDDATENFSVRKLMKQPEGAGGSGEHKRNINRYNLCFYQESKQELQRLKLEGLQPYKKASPEQREIDQRFYEGYDFPIRPEWNYNMSKETVERNENKYFREYVTKLQEKQKTEGKDLSLFELNLETWRQLWRVLELSDILLIIVDIRYATLMFPPALYDYVVNVIKKQAILILNKVDLVMPEVVVAWHQYFLNAYPKMPVIIFASNPLVNKKGTQHKRRLNYKRMIEGVYKIYEQCKNIAQSDLDLLSWEEKILEDMDVNHMNNDDDDEVEAIVQMYKEDNEELYDRRPNDENNRQEKYTNGILTLGCVGFPNVGKSSLINALKGRKVVSVSRTPGHTKHFQTIFLTNNVRLCDCPGLVFPSNTSKYLQVLLGSFPISQLQVPYRSIQLMAEHLDLPKILKINLPEFYDEWSAVAIADAWALKRGFMVAKTNRPDRYRAANHLLRCCVAGQCQLILQFYPPKFHEQIEQWQQHPQIQEVKKYQNLAENDPNEEEDESLPDNDFSSSPNTDDSNKGDSSTSNEDNDDLTTRVQLPSQNIFAALEDD